MHFLITRFLTGVLAWHAVSCAHFASENSVRFSPTSVPGEHVVKIGGKPVGTHKNPRGPVKMCGHLNSNRTWLVVEDGCGGDSYPKVTAYRLAGGELRESVELERINKEHHFEYSQGRGPTDPVFLGFDPSGSPVINSATGKHILSE